MRESLVGFCHAMYFFALLHSGTAAFGSLDQLGSQAQAHGLFAALARCITQPAHSQRTAATRTYFDRYLIVGTAHTTALDFHHRTQVADCQGKYFKRILAALLSDLIKRTIQNAFGDRLLAARHQHVDKFGYFLATEFGIGQNIALGDFSTSWHVLFP